MGTPKALMQVDGTAWWRMQHQSLIRIGVRDVWVVSPTVAAAFELEPLPPMHVIVPASPDGTSPPMFASVLRGLAECPNAVRVFILPVDVPCPSPSTLASLSQACGDGVAVPVLGGKTGHPICLSAAFIRDHLGDGHHLDPTVARLDELTRACAIHVPVDDSDILANLNTPHMLEAWLAQRRSL